MHLGSLKDLFKVLAGDLSHSRSVSRSVRPPLQNSLSSGFRAAALDEEYVSAYVLAIYRVGF